MYKTKHWTPEQISKMNEESFLVEMLDMFQYSPSNADSNPTEQMRQKLDAIEEALKTRLDAKRND
ncbi:hypothetical protein [Marinobacterium sediminicola]|uniref:Uncharacterized protein n=1 Tax=Marinobacterium sediminicola TaxID=518898 RepID=A0ABY1S141_9GAMM|nr:hypothetical protein [Marinobacterium sediminicola]ULG69805.1 hypothetical protein LN244_03075 [Marinobacterium sediminicola]SMR75381.1 hypothetical protein SAMN04487964_10943 [Marinobacterium sediminicola]